MKFILFINVKMPTTVGILTFISRINISTPVGPVGQVLWEELLGSVWLIWPEPQARAISTRLPRPWPEVEFSGRVQWLSGRVLDSRPRGHGFEPHRRHCVVVLEQDTFILA